MPIEQIILLALIQGLTEFLPISSSAHLILLPELTELEDQGALMDVAVHVGSLFAVMAYFRHEVVELVAGVPHLLKGSTEGPARLLFFLIIATLPTVFIGGALYVSGLVDLLRNAEVIAWATIIFGIVLYFADRMGRMERRVEHLTLKDVILIGLAQVLALIPGTSRSGITVTAGRFLHMNRREAARFSMLLSIPTIAAFGLLAGLDLMSEDAPIAWQDAGLAIGLSFASAFVSIWFFLKLLERMSLTPFVLYRLALGAGLLVYLYA